MNSIGRWLSKIFAVFWAQPFIALGGFAALAHSTWSISTLFHGVEPALFTLDWFIWVLFGFALAFAVDVGQISISADLRNGERTRFKYGSFAFLAALSYYFQWVYLVTHVPLLNLGSGVASYYIAPVRFMLDLGVWIVPALLPVSTVLYAFSYGKVRRTTTVSAERLVQTKMKIETPVETMTEFKEQIDAVQISSGERPKETALALLTDDSELMGLSLSDLQRRYPGISRTTWQRAKKECISHEKSRR